MLTDKVPDASTLSQNRRRRFTDSDIYQQIFYEKVLQSIRRKLVSGEVLCKDSTDLKANANMGKWTKAWIELLGKTYLDDQDRAVEEGWLAHGKNLCGRDPGWQHSRRSSRARRTLRVVTRSGSPKSSSIWITVLRTARPACSPMYTKSCSTWSA